MKLKEIAELIAAHLKRFELDPAINTKSGMNSKYYHTNSWVAGSKIGIRYISYQSNYFLTKNEALLYLAWLDEGNVGSHWRAID